MLTFRKEIVTGSTEEFADNHLGRICVAGMKQTDWTAHPGSRRNTLRHASGSSMFRMRSSLSLSARRVHWTSRKVSVYTFASVVQGEQIRSTLMKPMTEFVDSMSVWLAEIAMVWPWAM